MDVLYYNYFYIFQDVFQNHENLSNLQLFFFNNFCHFESIYYVLFIIIYYLLFICLDIEITSKPLYLIILYYNLSKKHYHFYVF